MTYTPNFSDPRVQRRIQRAIGFASGVMSATRSQAWSTRYIDQWFGVQSNPLSRYLREQLLTVTDQHWNKDTGKCKQYQLNTAGVNDLLARLDQDNTQLYPIVLQVAESEYKQQLESGEFVYNDQSQRLWHPLQNFRREIKTQVLESAGYAYHYDIECCAFNLIHQHSQQIPEHVINQKWQQGPMDLYLFALRKYISDRTCIRAEIAQETQVEPDVIKRIINALLAGARLSTNPTTEIYQLLGGDLSRIRFLQQHQYLTQLRADIKTCWDYIKPTLPRRSRTQVTGRERMIPVSSRQKWGVYFDLERQVLNEVREFLCETDNRHFLEHDGWSSEREIDQQVLCERIQMRTGFDVDFELTSRQHTTIPYCLTSF